MNEDGAERCGVHLRKVPPYGQKVKTEFHHPDVYACGGGLRREKENKKERNYNENCCLCKTGA